MGLERIVSVTIQSGTVSPSRESFGVPLILGYHTRFAENYRLYSGTAGMISDGFVAADPMFQKASAMFAQNPRPPQIMVGRLPAPATPHTTTLDVANAVSGDTITMNVVSPAGVSTAISVPYNTSVNQTATDLASAIDAISGIAASSATSVVTADADVNGEMWFFEDVAGPCEVLDTTADWGYDTQLDVIKNESDSFYVVTIDVNSDANISDVAAWAVTNKKLAFFGPQVTTPADYDATASPLSSGTNNRAHSTVKKTSRRQFPEDRIVGEFLPFAPGSQTIAHKRPTGLTADNWTETELVALELYNSAFAIEQAGVTTTFHGRAHGGEYIDITRGLDWLEARLKEAVLFVSLNNRKIPYTDSGVQIIVSAIKGVLFTAVAAGVLRPGTVEVTFLKVADIPAADRAARLLTGIEFSAEVAGAIQKTTFTGTVSA